MRYVLMFAALALLLVALGGAALGAVRERSGLDYARERVAMERLEAVAPVQTLAAQALALFPAVLAYTALGLAVLGVAAALARFRHERRPDAAGRLPVRADQLSSVSAEALAAYHATQLAAAQRQLVPHTFSPHTSYSHRADAGGVPVYPADVAPALPPGLPGVTDYADVAHVPNVNSILLGLGPGGAPVTVPMKSLWHIGVAGPTGNGKSNIARLVVAQLQALGAQVCIGDPKFTAYDAEQDEDWRPIAARLHREPAVTGRDIGALLRWAAAPETGELERRLELRRRGEKVGAPLFIYLDELPWIAGHVENAGAMIGDLVRVGRGVGLFLLVGTQDMLAKTVDLSAERDNFRTGFYLGGDRRTGSILLSLPQREVVEPEGLGVAMLRSAATQPAQLVRVPYASNRAVYKLLSDDAPAMPHLGNRPATEAKPPVPASGRPEPLSQLDAHILALAERGLPVTEIVKGAWDVQSKGGGNYPERSAYVMGLIAKRLRGEL